MQGCWAVGVEEEGWMGGWGRERSEVDGFLVPARGVGGGRVVGREPVGESWVVGWVHRQGGLVVRGSCYWDVRGGKGGGWGGGGGGGGGCGIPEGCWERNVNLWSTLDGM